MLIKSARFLISNTSSDKCPRPNCPEYAFIGRSNVGKSSLINMITGFRGLAKTSLTPGKTQLINHFFINEEWYLVDLPGYGFAKVPQDSKANWQKMTEDYIISRENLLCIFLLIDSRLTPQKNDLNFIQWLGEKKIPFVIVFTKADKQTKNKTASNIAQHKKEFLKTWEELPQIFVTSSETKTGREELLNFIEKTNKVFKKPTH